MFDEDIPPDPDYEIIPDRVVSLEKKKYDCWQAYHRFAEIAESQKLMMYQYLETPRHYIFRCLRKQLELKLNEA